ncbi:MAG: DUF5723 family protein [Bacteroidota bacterium]
MNSFTIIGACFTIVSAADAQSLNFNLPSDKHFPAFCLHHTSVAIMPSLNYQLNAKGQLFNSELMQNTQTSDFLKVLLYEGRHVNYLSFNITSNIFDIRKNHNKYELGFSMGIKSGGILKTLVDIPDLTPTESGPLKLTSDPGFKIAMNGYAAMSYSFSYLRKISNRNLQTVGFRTELLTGLNAVKGKIQTRGLTVVDTNTVNLTVESKGYIARSKKRLHRDELIPVYNNPGLAVSYGMQWQLSHNRQLSFNVMNLGFIYFNKTNRYLAHRFDTLNIRYGSDVYGRYCDSIQAYADKGGSVVYCLPFDLRMDYEYNIKPGHNLIMMAQYNPILSNVAMSLTFCRKIASYRISPSLSLVNFNTVLTGLGVTKTGRHISWGIGMKYLKPSMTLYQQTINENVILKNNNNWQTTCYVYYHIISDTKRLTSKKHKLVRTFIRN